MKKYVIAIIAGEHFRKVTDEIESNVEGNRATNAEYDSLIVDKITALCENEDSLKDLHKKYPYFDLSVETFDNEEVYYSYLDGLKRGSECDDEITWFSKIEDDGTLEPYKPVAWKVCVDDLSGEDFANYDTSALSPQQINEIIEEIDNSLANNDEMAEIFWATIRDIAESHGLKKRS